MIPVIICGGYGTRLWPLSRRALPKQFADLGFAHSLFQQTLLRLAHHPLIEDKPLLVANKQHRFLVLQQLQDIKVKPTDIILEPSSRNTAAAIALAALRQQQQGKGAQPMLVLPSDHLIANVDALHKAISQANILAADGHLVVFGVTPDYPETGYGYMETGGALAQGYSVASFTEKPDEITAKGYIESGQYYWNSGIFAFTPDAFLDELSILSPDVAHPCQQAWRDRTSHWEFISPEEDSFQSVDPLSVDYAVMEHTSKAAMIPLDAGWSDLGSWKTLLDKQDRTLPKNQCVVTVNSAHCHVKCDPSKTVGIIGVDDLLVVDTEDALLIAAKDASQDISELVKKLKQQHSKTIEKHRKIYRAWGWYEVLVDTSPCRVNRVQIQAGRRLCFRKHARHSEHWTVTSGTVEFFYQDKTIVLHTYESLFIPTGVAYQLINIGDDVLDIIEVQTGETSDFDQDLIRFKEKHE